MSVELKGMGEPISSGLEPELHPPNAITRKWSKHWVPQDTILNPGKCLLLKWVTDDTLNAVKEKYPEVVVQESEDEYEVVYLCSFEGCGKVFTEQGALRKHAQIHGDKQFLCHYEGCGKRFASNSKLKRHFLTHTGEKHFICPFDGCGKAFSLEFNLRSHMRIHTQENYHACPFEDCGKRYAHEYKLRAHMKTHQDKDCSVGACERNWSSYSLIHTKIRNRLSTSQLERLVYCRANLRLVRKVKAMNNPNQNSPSDTKQTSYTQSTREYVTPKVAVRATTVALERPFSCPYKGCDKHYIHEYKLNLHLRKEHTQDEPLEEEALVDERSERERYYTKRKRSEKGKTWIASNPPPLKFSARKHHSKATPTMGLNGRTQIGRISPTVRQIGEAAATREIGADSEETEDEEELVNTEDEDDRRQCMPMQEEYEDEETKEDSD